MKISYIFFTFMLIIVQLTATIASIVFFIHHISIDMEASLYAVFQIAALLSAVNTMIFSLFQRPKFEDVFTKFQNIYDESSFGSKSV